MIELKVIAGAKGDPGGEGRVPLRELYARYGGSVYGRCVYILKDKSQAEDAMQDVFAKALENYRDFRAESSPQTWLLQIATHHCLNVLRGERAGWRRRFAREEETRLQHGAGGPQAFEARDLLRKLLGRFDQETQAAAIHYHLDEMTLEEVAAALSRSVPTIRKRLEEVARACRKEMS
jgi:RNA polymerase sigma-70 factor (ECF subfamily)